jgi:hypothetical protein
MKLRHILDLPVIASLLLSIAAAQTVVRDQIRLTTPGAPWIIVIDGKLLSISDHKVKPDHKSAYFLMSPADDGLNISLYIEPVDKCKTAVECRDFVLNTGNPLWGKYQDLAKADIGGFSYFKFYRPDVMNQPLKMLDMYAQYVSNGYWVDLHLSKVEYKKTDHALFEDLIKSIKFVPKSSPAAGGDSEKHFESAQGAIDKWLAVWDAGRCKESFTSLSPLARERITEKLWVEYCGNAQRALGKLGARKPTAGSLIKSLPAKPEYSGATIRYQSAFANAESVIELVTLVLEKDGRWTVSNYMIQ